MNPRLSLLNEFGHYHIWWRTYVIDTFKSPFTVTERLREYNGRPICIPPGTGRSSHIEFNSDADMHFFILKNVK